MNNLSNGYDPNCSSHYTEKQSDALVLWGSFISFRRVSPHVSPRRRASRFVLSSSSLLLVIFHSFCTESVQLFALVLSLRRTCFLCHARVHMHLSSLFLFSASTLYLRWMSALLERKVRRSPIQKGRTIYSVICRFSPIVATIVQFKTENRVKELCENVLTRRPPPLSLSHRWIKGNDVAFVFALSRIIDHTVISFWSCTEVQDQNM